MAHTKGKWRILNINSDKYMWVGSDSEDVIICEIPQYNGQIKDNLRQIKNAHLIAAAPELLEALEEMLEAYAGKYTETIKTDGFNSLHSAVQKTVKAIAKAKGE